MVFFSHRIFWLLVLLLSCKSEPLGQLTYRSWKDEQVLCDLKIDLYGTDYTGECLNCDFDFGVKGLLSDVTPDDSCRDDDYIDARNKTMYCFEGNIQYCIDEDAFWTMVHIDSVDLAQCHYELEKSLTDCNRYSDHDLNEYPTYTNALIVGFYDKYGNCMYYYGDYEHCGFPPQEDWEVIASDQTTNGEAVITEERVDWKWSATEVSLSTQSSYSVEVEGGLNIPLP
jgi:hypothetical protein